MTYRTACGGTVIVSRTVTEHMRAHPVSRRHLAEAISTLTLPRDGSVEANVDLGRLIGVSVRVDAPPPEDGSTILAALRRGRKSPSRVVVDTRPEPTSSLAVVIRSNAGNAHLITAFYGTLAPPEPGDPRLTGEALESSLEFWSRQALVWSEGEYAGPPFETTWDRIREDRWRKDARTPYQGPSANPVP